MGFRNSSFSGWEVCDLGRLELTFSRQVYSKVRKHASKQDSRQVSGSKLVHRRIGLRICSGS